ncbi:MAG: cysteine desulfurase [Candidatus Dormibacteraeota bacterium]|nr:cysteine desulfurase [Candidatus Dormibacteraeota bacterium]
MEAIYLDHAATTPVHPAVLEAMLPYLRDVYGNPSSVHAAGRVARAAVDDARDALAGALQCAAREVLFTGSGTEADNLALRGTLQRYAGERGRHLVVSAIEHDAVLDTARRLEATGAASLTVVGCDAGCRVDPEEVAAAVRPDTVCVSVMLVNNETGTVQDIAATAELVHRRNPRTLVHTDAAQAVGRVRVVPDELGVDLVTVVGHKIYAPKGVGALWVRDGVFVATQMTGGGQERTRRSGTENVAGVVGLGAAARLAVQRGATEAPRQAALCARLLASVTQRVPDAIVTGDPDHRAPGFATVVVPGARTDVLLVALDSRGVQASGGSACSTGAPTPSHVLLAIGIAPELAACALRCTTGIGTTEAAIDRAADVIVAAVDQVRRAPTVAIAG